MTSTSGGPQSLPVEHAVLIVLEWWELAEPGPGNAVELAQMMGIEQPAEMTGSSLIV